MIIAILIFFESIHNLQKSLPLPNSYLLCAFRLMQSVHSLFWMKKTTCPLCFHAIICHTPFLSAQRTAVAPEISPPLYWIMKSIFNRVVTPWIKSNWTVTHQNNHTLSCNGDFSHIFQSVTVFFFFLLNIVFRPHRLVRELSLWHILYWASPCYRWVM